MKIQNKKFAFSLIELSIVILIIGILVVGISQGSRIVSEARLKTARSLTRSSVVNSISNLVLWVDATNAETISTGTTSANEFGNPVDEGFVVSWKNQSLQNSSNIVFTADTDDNRPKYVEKSASGLPAIQFDGSDDHLISNTPISSPKPTIFIVYKTPSTSTSQVFLLGIPDMLVGIPTDDTIAYARYEAGSPTPLDFITSPMSPALDNNKFHILSLFDNYGGNAGSVKIFADGEEKFSSSAGPAKTTHAAASFSIGYSSNTMAGELSEIIMFSRVLKESERKSVEQYLAQKYGIKIVL